MSNENTDEKRDYSEVGALPSLNASGNEKVLGAPVTKAKSKTNVGKLFYLIAFMAAALFIVFGLLFFFKNRAKKAEEAHRIEQKVDPTKVNNKEVKSESVDSLKAAIKKREEQEAAAKQAEAAKAETAKTEADRKNNGSDSVAKGGAPAGKANASADQKPKPTRQEMRLNGDVLFAGTNVPAPVRKESDTHQSDANQPKAVQNSNYTPGYQAPVAVAAPQAQSLESRLQPTVLEARNAGHLGDLDYLLKKGTMIPCALKTGIDTTLPGFLTCNVISDVYSANGNTKLIERGASIFGDSKNAMMQGQARIFAVWTRIDNPSGITAEVDSPGTDEMGYNGIPGYVDDHFWQRFGGAIMLSVIQDSLAAVVEKEANNNSSNSPPVQITNTTSATQTMAAEALKNSINIPPTGRTLPATIIQVMVARDISFQSVYKVVQ